MTVTDPAQLELFCPACGYDLRGIASEKCPECGLAIDRDVAARSRIPWVYRHDIGRWRAYWRTAWLASWRLKDLAAETIRPVDANAARRFARIVWLTITLPLVAGLFWAILDAGGTNLLNPMRDDSPSARRGGISDIILSSADFILPLAAGMTLWPVVPIGVVLFGWLFPTATRFCFTGGDDDASRTRRQRCAAALSYYSAGPLAFVVFGLIAWVVGAVVMLTADKHREASMMPIFIVCISGGWIFILICLLTMYINTLRLLRRTTHASAPKVLWVGLALPLSWGICGVLALMLMPWVAGFLWLILDSLLG